MQGWAAARCLLLLPGAQTGAAPRPHLDCVDVFCALLQAKLLEHQVATRLQQLADDTVWLRQIALQQQHTAALLQQHQRQAIAHNSHCCRGRRNHPCIADCCVPMAALDHRTVVVHRGPQPAPTTAGAGCPLFNPASAGSPCPACMLVLILPHQLRPRSGPRSARGRRFKGQQSSSISNQHPARPCSPITAAHLRIMLAVIA